MQIKKYSAGLKWRAGQALAAAALMVALSVVTAPQSVAAAAPPAMPTDVAAEAWDATTIRVTWRDKSGDESSFEIDNGEESWTATANSESFNWAVELGTYMCVKVRSVNKSGASAWSPNASPYYACTKTPGQPVPNGCSLVDSQGPDFNFREACNGHDQCYMDKGGRDKTKAVKTQCDDDFLKRMQASCSNVQPPRAYRGCLARAKLYRYGVAGSASNAYFMAPNRADRAGPPSRN